VGLVDGDDLISGALAPMRQRRAEVLERLAETYQIDASAIARAELVSARTRQPVEQVLNQLGSLTDDDLASVYADVSGCGIWEPAREPAKLGDDQLGVSADFLRRNRVLPLRRDGNVLVCAACDPLDDEALSGLIFATGGSIRILAARPAEWRREFDRVFGGERTSKATPDERRLETEVDLLSDRSSDGAGARLVSDAFEAAIALGASDIHFEPTRHNFRIRLRVDGRLIEHQVVSADLAAPAVSRVKVIANLNLGERRLPQDGRTSFVVQGRQVDVRVATSPTVFGESAVLRLLDRISVPLDLDALGLSAPTVATVRRAIKAAHGIFLITGPTGSGKTTTLYAILQSFVGSERKMLSVEDPVEYHFEHVAQTQIAPHLGLTFASALRSFLRQDPDIILVGEIRDPETASVAIQAAMTGHLVLASVHANNALAVLPRLSDMGIEPYQLAAGFKGAVAQRLVRKLCVKCASKAAPNESEMMFVQALGLEPPAAVPRAEGCRSCKSTGFKGRLPISEAFVASEDLLRAVADRRPASEIAEINARSGWRSMMADGYDKVCEGLTTIEEVMAAVHG
jgi:type II secretory ATPase GspE/PulE/Tfp pilus assembly ATPase PilB-like protein